MSSSYVVEPQDSSSQKKDDTLIIVVNDDGVISVDQATLQNLIMNQSSTNVSVVRLGQADADNENGDITLTVDPPTFAHSTASSVSANASTDPGGLVDPFMEMDPEQLERLETALQSEEAKQILGENVTAMLDMLSLEEQQNTMRHNIRLDHCYTCRFSPSDPAPRDPLPVVEDLADTCINIQYMHQSSSPRTSLLSQSMNDMDNAGVKNKNTAKTINILQSKQMSRTIRKTATPANVTGSSRINTNIVGTPKLPGHHSIPRYITTVQQGTAKLQGKSNKEEEDDEVTESSSDSSEPEPSDNDSDSDFGPRSSKRSNARSRGGRKGLTTRGGSMTAVRRRGGQNKQMDMEQVRLLDMEMAAAVNAMKTPEKDDKSERFSPTKSKRQIKTLGGKKKEESQFTEVTPSVSQESSPAYEKPLQTTNQVKANLINANMIKDDMILTKLGQGRSQQRVTFIQKQIPMKPNELKNIGLKKAMLVSKEKITQSGAKFLATKDGKLLQIPLASKTIPNTQVTPVKAILTQQATSQQSVTQQPSANQGSPTQQQPKITVSVGTPIKIKPSDIKREKRKSDTSIESLLKVEENSPVKSLEIKTLDSAKKPKRDNRKAPGFVADSLGPALFSTPDIIRRVGSNSDGKVTDNPTTPTTVSTPFATVISTSVSPTSPVSTTVSLNIGISPSSNIVQNPSTKKTIFNASEQSVQPEPQLNLDGSNSITPESENEQKSESKPPLTEELQPSLDTGGIEGEEHLLTTLEMEANKHEEELLAEALLLQEELGVDLPEHPALGDPRPRVIPEPLASGSILMPTLIPPEQDSKPAEVVPTAPTNMPKETSKKPTKDDKEVIQIIRGNRVIKLPPIEAPATRSKRLQAKSETPQINPEPTKKVEKPAQVSVPPQAHNKDEFKMGQIMNAEEEEDDEDDEEDNSDSEDDPDRLWCICKRPHNNRFMICCDVCEDWFHGKCVHVSKAMGQQMEEKGIEWVCPNCLRKKAEEEKMKSSSQSLLAKQKAKVEFVGDAPVPLKETPPSSSSTDHSAAPASSTMQCVVCKKEARNSSIYCSDACILAHAQETLTKEKPVPSGSNIKPTKSSVTEAAKAKPEARVVVFDRKTGADAPLRSSLRTWLKDNPTYEIVEANNINTLQIGGKFVTQIQTSGKTAKITQISPVKVQSMPKMIYTKVVGTKQTVLAPNKKITIIPAMQQQASVSPGSKPAQLKQTIISASGKSPLILKTSKTVTQLKTQAAGSPKQTPIKKQEAKSSPSQLKQQTKLTPVRKPETEPIRVNIRKTLTELLSSRIKETEDLKITDDEIAELAFNIELEMYKYFKDTGSKYKAKYRSLVFNIKDTKNLTLFRKIADRSLTPDAVVRLSPDEMASQELAEWREKETKHQLEMIKKNELDLMAQAKSIVVKTHKGEQIIENDGGIDHVDPKTPVQDIVSALNNGDNISSTVDDLEKNKNMEDRLKEVETKKSKGADERRRKDKERGRERDGGKSKSKDRRERSRSRHRRSRDRDRSKTRDKSKERKSIRNKESRRDKDREKDKDRDRNKDRDKTSRKESRERDRLRDKDRHKSNDDCSRNRSGSRESKDVDKREEERKKEMEKKKEISPPPAEKPIEDRLWRHIEDEATTNTIDGNDSDISDREPSSTVTIKTPDINEEPERDKEQVMDKETSAKGSWQTVWRGFVNMVDVAKFFITAQEVSGNAKDLIDDLPDTVDVVGRISHETVWDYISKMKRSGSKEILVIRLTAANDEEKIPYITLYSYLNSRSRLGVVGNVSKNIKDFYIMPFSSQSTIPPVLMPLTGPGFEENRPHLLLGIIVRNKKKRLSVVPPVSSKTSKTSDRSYTPPLIGAPKEKSVLPSPSSSPMLYKTIALDSKEKTAAAATPTATATVTAATVTQMTLESLNKAHIGMSRGVIDTATICKIVPELSSKIVDLTSSPGRPDVITLDDDGDEPYSPGDDDDDDDDDDMNLQSTDTTTSILSSSNKNPTELQRKMDELNRQIEEQKQQIEEQRQQIQSISSSFLDEATPTLPGLGLDPPTDDCDEAYSPSNARSFTPPPPISKFAQPILDKVSDITIPPNLQEILANVKRQESTKVDPYLPSKPSASFLPTLYQNTERYSPTPTPSSRISQSDQKAPPEAAKETKSTLSTLSDLDLIRKAEEELAAVALAAAAASAVPVPPPSSSSSSSSLSSVHVLTPPPIGSANDTPTSPSPQVLSSLPLPAESASEADKLSKSSPSDPFKKSFTPEQPKPPGLEDEDFPTFPSTPPAMDVSKETSASHSKVSSKSGIVLNVKRKLSDNGSSPSPTRLPRRITKSRWGQRPSE
ncbi:PREDICTED: death-inducer obliterator 1 isoform X2 [Vollenhovia emeryi]|uniref:death-inducer obliterator 1 isoform X2 n=1 Tax=Vollenhovia emeryi TaxID=411798 RepID=UPI0005F5521B|nr:PREDICTED: death-inducer obliterator 1 isoform X2 [Vollenhovia emeryi]